MADGRHGVVVLSNNTAAKPNDLGFATLDANAPLAPAYKAIVLPSASLDDYVGSYALSDKFQLKIFRRNDGLIAEATGRCCPVAIFPSAPNEFFAIVVDAQLAFVRDGGEKVVAVVVHQGGRVIRAPRIVQGQ